MSHINQYEVKVQLKGGLTQVTMIYAETDYKARELTRMQFGSALVAIHYVHLVK